MKRVLIFLAVALVFALGAQSVFAADLELVGVTGAFSSISDDGKFVTIAIRDDGALLSDRQQQVYLMDRATGELTLVSVDAYGNAGNLWSARPLVSPDARFVLFSSYSSDLANSDAVCAPEGGSVEYVYLRDMAEGTTRRISGDCSLGPDFYLRPDFTVAPRFLPDGRILYISNPTMIGDSSLKLVYFDPASGALDVVSIPIPAGNRTYTFRSFNNISSDGQSALISYLEQAKSGSSLVCRALDVPTGEFVSSECLALSPSWTYVLTLKVDRKTSITGLYLTPAGGRKSDFVGNITGKYAMSADDHYLVWFPALPNDPANNGAQVYVYDTVTKTNAYLASTPDACKWSGLDVKGNGASILLSTSCGNIYMLKNWLPQ